MMSIFLFDAVKKGNLKKVKRMFSAHECLEVDVTNKTPLHIASWNGDLELCKYLVDKGADIDFSTQNTPLLLASSAGKNEVVEYLLQNGADIHARDESHWTPLHFACCEDHLEVATTLLSYGADASLKTNDNKTSLDVSHSEEILDLFESPPPMVHTPVTELLLQEERDEKERIDLVMMEGLGTAQFLLSEETNDDDSRLISIRVWKSLLVNSSELSKKFNVDYFESKTSMVFSNLQSEHLEALDERVILNILLSKEGEVISLLKQQQQLKNSGKILVDHYLFFQFLGLREEMLFILNHFIIPYLETSGNIEEIYHVFKSFACVHENERVKSWFSENPYIYDDFTFDLSILSHVFFERLKKSKLEDVYHHFSGKSCKYMPFVFYRAWSFPNTLEKDEVAANDDDEFVVLFDNNNNNERNGPVRQKNKTNLLRDRIGLTLRKLWETQKLSNVILKTIDGGTFKAHIEILIWKLNFFSLMMRFKGSEYESFKNEGVINLVDIGANEMEILLRYVYTGEVLCRRSSKTTVDRLDGEKKGSGNTKLYFVDTLRSLIQLCVHCEKYNETSIVDELIREIRSMMMMNDNDDDDDRNEEYKYYNENEKKKDVLKLLKEIGHIFGENDKLKVLILPIFKRIMSEEEFILMVSKSESKKKKKKRHGHKKINFKV